MPDGVPCSGVQVAAWAGAAAPWLGLIGVLTLEPVYKTMEYAQVNAVLAALVGYVGRDNFFAGIKRYLAAHAYANATLTDLLGSGATLQTMREAHNPYGDGHASERIAQAIAWHFGLAERPADWTP